MSLCLAALLVALLAPPAAASDYVVNANPYNVTNTLSETALWDAYELTAGNGQQVTYTFTVTTPGACAMLLFVQGHTVTTESQLHVAYSQESCVSSFTKTFPVASSDGTEFSIAILTTYSGPVTYNLNVNVAAPGLPPIVIWIVVGALAGAAIGAVGYMIRKRRRPSMPPTPLPYPGTWAPPAPPTPPQVPPESPPMPPGQPPLPPP